MSLLCRLVIGYFDADAACKQRAIVPTRRLNEKEVVRLQAACDEAFSLTLRLAKYVTRDGLLSVEDVIIRPDSYKAAAVAHGLFGMSAVDHAHRNVLFPAKVTPLPTQEEFMRMLQSLDLGMDAQERWCRAEESLQWMRQQREFEDVVQERVRLFAAEWKKRREQTTFRDEGRITA
jgi:hypothetical protein